MNGSCWSPGADLSVFKRRIAEALYGSLFFLRRKFSQPEQGIGTAEEQLLPRAKLDADRVRTVEQELLWLRGALRRAPYWIGGHLLAAERAVDAEQFALAYASALTVLECERNPTRRERAALVIGRCLLGSGRPEAAAPYLESAAERPEFIRAREELAACYLALNELEKGAAVLAAIPADRLSQSGRTALEFVRRTKQ